MEKKTFNLYCDESCHIQNDHKPYMFFGRISSPYNEVKVHTARVNEIKNKHNFYAEIKWSPVSNSKIDFYTELVDYFFSTDLKFRAVGVDKSQIKCDDFGKTFDEFYFTMYYYLLNHKVDSSSTYNVYLDIKDTLGARKVKRLKDILNSQFGVFRNIQSIHSHESTIMQLTDFLMGAVSYLHNNEQKINKAKVQLIDKIMEMSGDKLQATNYSQKLNLFFIELR